MCEEEEEEEEGGKAERGFSGRARWDCRGLFLIFFLVG